MTPPAGLFLVATLHGEPAGCGALKFHPGAPAEIKRMWVAAAVRGLGLGGRLLAELEGRAAAQGVGRYPSAAASTDSSRPRCTVSHVSVVSRTATRSATSLSADWPRRHRPA